MGVTNLTRWPWTLDSADVGGTIPALPFTIMARLNNGPFGQKTDQNIALGWVNWTAVDSVAGDQVILKDIDGIEVWRSQPATGADFKNWYHFPQSVKVTGLILAQMQHGILEIFFR